MQEQERQFNEFNNSSREVPKIEQLDGEDLPKPFPPENEGKVLEIGKIEHMGDSGVPAYEEVAKNSQNDGMSYWNPKRWKDGPPPSGDIYNEIQAMREEAIGFFSGQDSPPDEIINALKKYKREEAQQKEVQDKRGE